MTDRQAGRRAGGRAGGQAGGQAGGWMDRQTSSTLYYIVTTSKARLCSTLNYIYRKFQFLKLLLQFILLLSSFFFQLHCVPKKIC